jgi:carboxylesterase type B
MTSPASAGLFHRVIQQSNPAGFAYLSPQHAAVYGDALVSKAGCGRPPKGTTQLDCLRNVSASVIMVRASTNCSRPVVC